MSTQTHDQRPPFLPRTIRRFALLIILGWLAVIGIVNFTVPPLELVEAQHAASLQATDAPSYAATQRIAANFKEAESANVGIIVIEGQQPLGDDAHRYYDQLIRALEADPVHVQHIQNFWGDALTQGAAQSADGKAVYVQFNLAGQPGAPISNESVVAVQRIVAQTPAPPGIKAYVTGPAAVVADMGNSGDRTVTTITMLSIAVIFVILLIVYRSIVTTILLLVVVGIELQVARAIVALLGHIGMIELSTYAVNLLVALAIAAGTDYGIFFIGRYHEARQAGEDREKAFYTTYRSVAPVVLGSGLTIAGAVLCMSFTRLPFFRVLGVPCAVGITVSVLVALTLFPAVLSIGSRFGIFDPKRNATTRGWRRIGTAIVRWPVPILTASLAVALIGLLTLPGFKPSYNDQNYLPRNIPATLGLEAASRHFPESAMLAPDMLLVETDHDLRNPADFLVLNKLAKAVLAVPGVSRVQAVTRPEGTPVAHSTIPYLISMQQASQKQFMVFQNARMDDLLKQGEMLGEMIVVMKKMYSLMQQMVDTTNHMAQTTHEMEDITLDLRNHIADFDDFMRPVRNYLYWEPHCDSIPLCWAVKSLFETIDGIDGVADKLRLVVADLDQMTVIMPQLLQQFPEMLAIMESMRTMMLTMHSTMAGTLGQADDGMGDTTAMAKAFDTAKNDDSFYAPPELFNNADFKRIQDIFISPDGKSVRMIIFQKGDPASAEGMSRVDPIKTAAEEALKGTPLEDSKIYLTGTAATVKDLVVGSRYDLMIAVISALCLIFIVMLIMTRSLIAAMVIVGTVLISLGASFGLSVLLWQYLIGRQIHWAVLVMSVIILLAVGSDYNLLLVARMKEELAAGLNTGIIRAMAGTGKVVTTAGLVFAFTMMTMVVSDLTSIGQVGTTIGLGLLFDTLIVRAFMTPSIAAALGRWFWWPQRVRPRPASAMLRPTGPRPLVRALLQGQEH